MQRKQIIIGFNAYKYRRANTSMKRSGEERGEVRAGSGMTSGLPARLRYVINSAYVLFLFGHCLERTKLTSEITEREREEITLEKGEDEDLRMRTAGWKLEGATAAALSLVYFLLFFIFILLFSFHMRFISLRTVLIT